MDIRDIYILDKAIKKYVDIKYNNKGNNNVGTFVEEYMDNI